MELKDGVFLRAVVEIMSRAALKILLVCVEDSLVHHEMKAEVNSKGNGGRGVQMYVPRRHVVPDTDEWKHELSADECLMELCRVQVVPVVDAAVVHVRQHRREGTPC